jgi:hypothetical protein
MDDKLAPSMGILLSCGCGLALWLLILVFYACLVGLTVCFTIFIFFAVFGG